MLSKTNFIYVRCIFFKECWIPIFVSSLENKTRVNSHTIIKLIQVIFTLISIESKVIPAENGCSGLE